VTLGGWVFLMSEVPLHMWVFLMSKVPLYMWVFLMSEVPLYTGAEEHLHVHDHDQRLRSAISPPQPSISRRPRQSVAIVIE